MVDPSAMNFADFRRECRERRLRVSRPPAGEPEGAAVLRRLRTLLLVCALSAPGGSLAQGPYLEARAGLVPAQSVTGRGPAPALLSESVAGGDVRATLEYGAPTVVGLESGMRRIGDTPVAVSASLDTFRMELDGATMDDGDDRHVFSVRELADAGIDFDQRVLLVGVNGFYEVEREKRKYYGGVGLGSALVGNADAEFGLFLHAGFRYEIEPLGYLNARITWFRSGAPQHKATGLQLDELQFIMATLALGLDL